MSFRRTLLVLLAALPGAPLLAQTAPSRAYDPKPDAYRSPAGAKAAPDPRQGARPPREELVVGHYETLREVEVALSDASFWAALRSPTPSGFGYVELGFLRNDDDDTYGSVRFLRFGSPPDLPNLRLGLGLGLAGAWLDQVQGRDEDVYALDLCGSARVGFDTSVPTALGLEVAWAPDVVTWDGGDHLVDAVARFDVEVSSFATAFVGYRFLEVGLDGKPDQRIDDRLHVGIRLGF